MTLTEEQRGTGGFDLEAARASISHYRIENTSNADTESALKELVDQANLAEDALAEIERLRAGAIKGNQFVNELMANCNSLRERVWKADARIKELEANCIYDQETGKVFVPDGHPELEELRARNRDLERALVEERANKMIQSDDCTQNEDAADFHHRCICEYNVKKCPMEQWWLDRARITLQAEGKIGPDAAKPQSWQITEERKATLAAALKVLERLGKVNTDTDHSYLDRGITALRAMLTEAGQ